MLTAHHQVFSEELAAHKVNPITALVRKNKHTARMFANSYKDHLIPLNIFFIFLLQKGDNVILMGSPGAGKTSVGRILGAHLGKKVIDVDDDVLEDMWGMTVAEKVVKLIFIY